MKRLVIFNWTGTIVDKHSIAPLNAIISTFKQTYDRFKIQAFESEIKQYNGTDLLTHLNKLTQREHISSYLYPRLFKNMKHETFEHSRPTIGIMCLFNHLKKNNYAIGSISPYPRELLNIAADRARLEGLDIPLSVAFDETPEPVDQILLNAKNLHLDPSNTTLIKIGNDANGIKIGIQCNQHFREVITIGIAETQDIEEQMFSYGADYVVDDVRRIRNILL